MCKNYAEQCKLMICDTNYQLLTAIQMKLTIFQDSSVDIWISDHSREMDSVANNLQEIGLFRSVSYIQTKKAAYEKNKCKLLFDVVKHNFGRKSKFPRYEEIIFYGLDLLIYSIADYYQTINHVTKWSRYEEGLFSYESDFSYGRRVALTRKIRKFTKRVDIAEKISQYYCFYPALKETHREWNLVEIPKITETKDAFVRIINEIYNYSGEQIEQKYIFFASSSDNEGNGFGETELVLRISEVVGKENLLVKTHPRDTSTVYRDHNIPVMEKSFLPWEIVQLNTPMKEKVLLTVNSGAFIGISAMCDDDVTGIFLFPVIKTSNRFFNTHSADIERMLNKLHNIQSCSGIKMINCEESSGSENQKNGEFE